MVKVIKKEIGEEALIDRVDVEEKLPDGGYGACTGCNCRAYVSNNPPNDICANPKCKHSFWAHKKIG